MHWDGHIPFYMVGIAGTERAKRLAEWGTYGKTGDQPLTYVKLVDCSTEHLQAILRTQKQVWGTDYELLIREILKDRDAVQPPNLARADRHRRLMAMWASVALMYGITTFALTAYVTFTQKPVLHPRFLMVTAALSFIAFLWGGWKLKQVWE